MSMYASTVIYEQDQNTKRQPVLTRKKQLGIVQAKRALLKDQFLIGDLHEGDLDEMIVKGSSVLTNEINHARSIPMNERVLIRKESSVLELQKEEDIDTSNVTRGSENNM